MTWEIGSTGVSNINYRKIQTRENKYIPFRLQKTVAFRTHQFSVQCARFPNPNSLFSTHSLNINSGVQVHSAHEF